MGVLFSHIFFWFSNSSKKNNSIILNNDENIRILSKDINEALAVREFTKCSGFNCPNKPIVMKKEDVYFLYVYYCYFYIKLLLIL